MTGPPPLTDPTKADAELLDAAAIEIEPARISIAYQAGLVAVAFGMLLLPILYVALIGAIMAGTGLWAVHAPGILFQGSGAALWRGVAYAAPLVAGLTGALFMVKPIFARPPAPPLPITLDRAREPLLHAFIERLCRAVGAPAPTEIRIDMQVNASASFRRGVRSMMGSDLVLTLGLPLVAGLDVRQLSGIVAHEFGHFTQAVAMRLTYLIGSVNHWFARVVFERDEWDVQLDTWSRTAKTGYVQFPIMLAQLSVMVSRRVLWVLMHVGHAMSAYLSRQMEYNADRYLIQVAGSDGFKPTFLRLGLQAVAVNEASAHLNALLDDGRLPDDLPALTEAHARRLAGHHEVMANLEQHLLGERTKLFDTHPSHADRIRAAEALGLAAKITCTLPASRLFRDFADISRRASGQTYRLQLGDRLADLASMTTDDAVHGMDALVRQHEATTRVLLSAAVLQFGVAPARLEHEAPATVAAGLATLVEARKRVEAVRGSIPELIAWGERVHQRRIRLLTALLCQEAGMRLPKDLDLPATDLDSLRRLEREIEEERRAVRAALAPVVDAISLRVDGAVSLARHPEVMAQLDAVPTPSDYRASAYTLQAIAAAWLFLSNLRDNLLRLSLMVGQADAYREDERFQDHATRLINETHDMVKRMRGDLEPFPYPFDHARDAMSVGAFVVPSPPPASIEILSHAGGAAERLIGVYTRCWGEIAVLVEQVEEAVGLARLDSAPPPGESANAEGDADLIL